MKPKPDDIGIDLKAEKLHDILEHENCGRPIKTSPAIHGGHMTPAASTGHFTPLAFVVFSPMFSYFTVFGHFDLNLAPVSCSNHVKRKARSFQAIMRSSKFVFGSAIHRSSILGAI